MSERTIYHEIRYLKEKFDYESQKLQQKTVKISITDTILKDAKRSDFVRNRDMEGDIDMDMVPLYNIMLKLSVNNYDLRKPSLITFP